MLTLSFLVFGRLALAAGTAPVAEAGLGVLAYPGDTVVLNGTGSNDVDGENLAYTWTQTIGAPVDLQDGATPEPSFIVPAAGPYAFELVVNDGTLESAADSVSLYAPDRELQPDGESGCAVAPGAASLALATAAMGLALGRRRSR